MTGKIVWLASYPKSGNTWIRSLLSNYLLQDAANFSLNNLFVGGPIASDREIFDEYAGIDASDLTWQQVERYRPLVFDYISRITPDDPLILKIHDAFYRLEDGSPSITPASTKGVVYIVRNPLDVAVSYAEHVGVSIDESVQRLGSDEHRLSGWSGAQIWQFVMSWSRHVTGWLDDSRLAVELVRYEDLKADTAGVFARIVRFAGLEYHEDRLHRAVESTYFDSLQRLEKESGFNEKSMHSEAFFRRGKVGDWRQRLSPAHVTQIIADHGDVMSRLGYLDQQGNPVF